MFSHSCLSSHLAPFLSPSDLQPCSECPRLLLVCCCCKTSPCRDDVHGPPALALLPLRSHNITGIFPPRLLAQRAPPCHSSGHPDLQSCPLRLRMAMMPPRSRRRPMRAPPSRPRLTVSARLSKVHTSKRVLWMVKASKTHLPIAESRDSLPLACWTGFCPLTTLCIIRDWYLRHPRPPIVLPNWLALLCDEAVTDQVSI